MPSHLLLLKLVWMWAGLLERTTVLRNQNGTGNRTRTTLVWRHSEMHHLRTSLVVYKLNSRLLNLWTAHTAETLTETHKLTEVGHMMVRKGQLVWHNNPRTNKCATSDVNRLMKMWNIAQLDSCITNSSLRLRANLKVCCMVIRSDSKWPRNSKLTGFI